VDLVRQDAIVILQKGVLPDSSGHPILRDADLFSAQIGRVSDAAIPVHVDVAVAEVARWEEGNGNVALISPGGQGGVD
jgi:hypothetical protein